MEQKEIPTLIMDEDAAADLPTLEMPNTIEERFKSNQILERTMQIYLAGGCIVMFCLLIYLLLPDIKLFFSYTFKPAAARYWPNAAVVATLLVVGYNLYLFRGYKRLWFGIAELFIAVALGWFAVNKAVAGSLPDAVVVLIGALYLAGRGFVNISRRFEPLQIPEDDKA
jgi:hypothetical protein